MIKWHKGVQRHPVVFFTNILNVLMAKLVALSPKISINFVTDNAEYDLLKNKFIPKSVYSL